MHYQHMPFPFTNIFLGNNYPVINFLSCIYALFLPSWLFTFMFPFIFYKKNILFYAFYCLIYVWWPFAGWWWCYRAWCHWKICHARLFFHIIKNNYRLDHYKWLHSFEYGGSIWNLSVLLCNTFQWHLQFQNTSYTLQSKWKR